MSKICGLDRHTCIKKLENAHKHIKLKSYRDLLKHFRVITTLFKSLTELLWQYSIPIFVMLKEYISPIYYIYLNYLLQPKRFFF